MKAFGPGFPIPTAPPREEPLHEAPGDRVRSYGLRDGRVSGRDRRRPGPGPAVVDAPPPEGGQDARRQQPGRAGAAPRRERGLPRMDERRRGAHPRDRRRAIRDWHVNHIRLPLAQDRWFGKAPEQKDEGRPIAPSSSRSWTPVPRGAATSSSTCTGRTRGEWGKQIGQHVMPDRNSLAFWKEVAAVYKNHPAVIFDLYNEPHDVSWDVWRNGGEVTEKGKDGKKREFEAVGMQALLDAVRATGREERRHRGRPGLVVRPLGLPQGQAARRSRRQRRDLRQSCLSLQGRHRRALDRQDGDGDEDAARDRQRVRQRPGAQATSDWVRQVLQALEDHEWDWTAWDLHPAAAPA